MKVALVTNFPPNTGSGKYSYELFKALRKNGLDCDHILCSSEKVDDTKNVGGINFPVFHKTLNSFYVYPRKLPDGYDIYHSTNQFMVNVAAYKNPSVISILDLIMLFDKNSSPFLSRYLQTKYIFKNISKYKKIIAISHYTKSDIMKILKIPEEKIAVTHLGINEEIFFPGKKEEARERLGLPLDKKIVLHVGSEESRKNVSTLIKSFKKIKSDFPDALLIRIGGQSEETKTLIDSMNLSNSIKYFSGVDEKELSDFYRAADVFVFPSTYEGFGIPVVEAMASGCPVISSTATSLKELLSSDTPRLEDPTNETELAEKIGLVLNSENSDIIKSGLNKSKSFTWKNCAEQTRKVYEEVE